MKATLYFKHTLELGVCIVLATLTLALPAYAESDSTEDAGHEGGQIALTQQQIEHAGIGLVQVRSGLLQERLTVYGTVNTNPEQVLRVSARFDGVIRNINKRIGDTVKRGDTLFTVEANESMQEYTIVSTISGVVTHREVNIGEQTNGRTLLVIEDLSTVWVELSLFPKDLPQVLSGQKVRISSISHDLSSEGVVTYIAPAGNLGNQTVIARVPLSNPDGRWIPGQFVVGDIILSETNVPLLVSTDALQIIEQRSVIFVQNDDRFEPRHVELGRSDGRFTEVLSGVRSGETYVANNSFVLKSELGKEGAEHGH